LPIFSYHSALFKLSNVHVTAGAEVAVDAVAVVVLAVATGVEAAIPESAFWSSAFCKFCNVVDALFRSFCSCAVI
jgi:hypothetical protein